MNEFLSKVEYYISNDKTLKDKIPGVKLKRQIANVKLKLRLLYILTDSEKMFARLKI